MSALFVNPVRPELVPAPSADAGAFHAALPGYRPTPVHELAGGVAIKDESDRLGLPAFKVLGASWAVERALRERPEAGTLVAAAARFATHAGAKLIGVEPLNAACLTASLAAGEPTAVPTPGTSMAGLDCAEVSTAAWPSLRDGIHATVTIDDAEARVAMRELAAAGLAIGDCGAAPLAALRALGGAELRAAVGAAPDCRVLLIATEGPTDPEAYRSAVGY